MAQAHYKPLLGKVLLGFIAEKDPVLSFPPKTGQGAKVH
jgi:hypothetical protein